MLFNGNCGSLCNLIIFLTMEDHFGRILIWPCLRKCRVFEIILILHSQKAPKVFEAKIKWQYQRVCVCSIRNKSYKRWFCFNFVLFISLTVLICQKHCSIYLLLTAYDNNFLLLLNWIKWNAWSFSFFEKLQMCFFFLFVSDSLNE